MDDDDLFEALSTLHKAYVEDASHLMSFEAFVREAASVNELPIAVALVRLADLAPSVHGLMAVVRDAERL